VDWINLAQDRDQWRAFVNKESLTERLLASQQGLCSMEFVIKSHCDLY
jgi:hypothetical protein